MAIPDSPAPAPAQGVVLHHVPSPIAPGDVPRTVDVVVGNSPPSSPTPAARVRSRPITAADATSASPSTQRVQLTIPLDAVDDLDDEERGGREKVKKKKKILRRDSLDRREALLRGKEGSRRRRRWENDHFTTHPCYAPPTTTDWIPAPHYNFTPVPYQYASLYDHPELIRRREEAAAKARASRTIPSTVPRKLKERVKKAHGAASLVEMLEREVRAFVFGEPRPGEEMDDDEKKKQEEEDEDMVVVGHEVVSDEDASSEEEIVFVSKRERAHAKPETPAKSAAAAGKSGKMLDRGWMQRLVFEGGVEESFARWIVHTIAGYYGLTSWSVSSSSVAPEMSGKQEMRYSFVGMKTWEEIRDRRPLYMQL